MADWDFTIAPTSVTVEFEADAVKSCDNSIRLVNYADQHSGLGEWLYETANALPEERKRLNRVVAQLHRIERLAGVPDTITTYPDYLDWLADNPPNDYSEEAIGWLRKKAADYPGDDVVLADEATFVAFVQDVLSAKIEQGMIFHADTYEMLHTYLNMPIHEVHDVVVEHLRYMWDNHLAQEWRRIAPTVEEACEAFSQMDYTAMNAYEAIEAVTGRNMRGKIDDWVPNVETIIFMPSPHMGPYVGWFGDVEDTGIMQMFFGARPPKESARTPATALSRSELLVRLNALADETRLKILELLTRNDEMCAQDFITALELSQSSASRHLRQLTASGYISERRRDVAKCYTLNPDRIDDTIHALQDFLKKD